MRTGREEAPGGEKGRNSKDDKINRDGKKLVELIEDKDGAFLMEM